jgi:uncharacterized membrane protein YkvA (DUF1232 family)
LLFVSWASQGGFEVKRFDSLLEDDIKGYKGKFSDLIHQAPALYRLMTRLLDDPALPKGMSPLVIAAMAYFIKPGDIIPEKNLGPVGYVDDIFLCAFVADLVRKLSGDKILIRNWDGKVPVIPLIGMILSSENELIGNQRESIMQYIGYEELDANA